MSTPPQRAHVTAHARRRSATGSDPRRRHRSRSRHRTRSRSAAARSTLSASENVYALLDKMVHDPNVSDAMFRQVMMHAQLPPLFFFTRGGRPKPRSAFTNDFYDTIGWDQKVDRVFNMGLGVVGMVKLEQLFREEKVRVFDNQVITDARKAWADADVNYKNELREGRSSLKTVKMENLAAKVRVQRQKADALKKLENSVREQEEIKNSVRKQEEIKEDERLQTQGLVAMVAILATVYAGNRLYQNRQHAALTAILKRHGKKEDGVSTVARPYADELRTVDHRLHAIFQQHRAVPALRAALLGYEKRWFRGRSITTAHLIRPTGEYRASAGEIAAAIRTVHSWRNVGENVGTQLYNVLAWRPWKTANNSRRRSQRRRSSAATSLKMGSYTLRASPSRRRASIRRSARARAAK